MLLLKRRFRFDRDCWCSGKNMEVCSAVLDYLLNIPAVTKTIWISLHTKPAKHRIEARVRIEGYIYPYLRVIGKCIYFSHPTLDNLLAKHMGKTLYVEVEYEE